MRNRDSRSPRRRTGLWQLCTLLTLIGAALPASAELDADRALVLVEAEWFEGMPAHLVEPLSAEAVAALATGLQDPARVAHQAATLELLGRCGGPGAYEAIAAFADRAAPSSTASSRAERAAFRARLALPIALGHLARPGAQHDARALDRLAALATGSEASAEGTSRAVGRIDAARAARLARLAALSGLALVDTEAARAWLRTISRDSLDPAERARARTLLEAPGARAGEVR